MSTDLIQLMDYVARNRGLSKEDIFEMITRSVEDSARKAVQHYAEVHAAIDSKSGAISCWANLLIVDEDKPEDPAAQISLKEALTRKPGAKVGETIEWAIKIENFGRIAAQFAKQQLTTGLQDAERRNVINTFQSREGQLLRGTVTRRDRNGVWLELEVPQRDTTGALTDRQSAEALMEHKACIPGEVYEVGDSITVLLKSLNSDKPGASLKVSRSSPDFVRRLFEREVSEIMDGTVEIKGIAREPGYRTKIAVYSEQPKVDPVGACVGQRGTRVRNIVSELSGEKVDIINWSPDIRVFVENALKPAKLAQVNVNEKDKSLDIRVTDDQHSLSIGKKGQNVRLAMRLTGWKISISKLEKEADNAQNEFVRRINQAIQELMQITGVDEATSEILVGNGFHSREGLKEASVETLAGIEGITRETAEAIYAAVHAGE